MTIKVFRGDHFEKKSLRYTPFLGVFGPYNHPIKAGLDQTSVEGPSDDFFFLPQS